MVKPGAVEKGVVIGDAGKIAKLDDWTERIRTKRLPV